MFTRLMLPRVCDSPVDPSATPRLSAKACAWTWQVEHDCVPFPESRVS